ncbi:MAG: hypothetical protein AAGE99_05705, partial [Chlamydiota bacterium]
MGSICSVINGIPFYSTAEKYIGFSEKDVSSNRRQRDDISAIYERNLSSQTDNNSNLLKGRASDDFSNPTG